MMGQGYPVLHIVWPFEDDGEALLQKVGAVLGL